MWPKRFGSRLESFHTRRESAPAAANNRKTAAYPYAGRGNNPVNLFHHVETPVASSILGTDVPDSLLTRLKKFASAPCAATTGSSSGSFSAWASGSSATRIL